MQENSKFKLHFKNPFDSAFNDTNDTHFLQKVESEFTPKTYDKENKDLFFIAVGVSILCNVVSGSTSATHVYAFLGSLIPYLGLTVALTIVCLLALELCKRYILPKLFKSIIQFKTVPWGLLFVAFGLMCVSTAFSYFGAKTIIFATAKPVELTNVGAITSDFDKDIQEIESAKKSYFEANKVNENGKSVLAYKARKQYENFDKSLLSMREKKQAAKDKAESHNETKLFEGNADTSGKAGYFGAFTLFIEIVLGVCMYYTVYYKYRSYVDRTKFAANARQIHENEANILENEIGIKQLTPVSEPQKSNGNTAPQTQIGFQNVEKVSEKVNENAETGTEKASEKAETERPKIGFHTGSAAVTTQCVNNINTQCVSNNENECAGSENNCADENENIKIISLPNGKAKVIAHFKIGEKNAPFEKEFENLESAQMWKKHISKNVPIDTTTQAQAQTQTQVIQASANYVIKVCENCGKDYERKTTRQKFCTDACRYEKFEKEKGVSVNTIIAQKAKKRSNSKK